MKENKYDNQHFFEQYSQMPRSKEGLKAAGEWHEFKKLLPDFNQKTVLDLGCGFGWHCIYAAEHGAKKVVGIDLSERMLTEARQKTTSPVISYQQKAIEDIKLEPKSYEVVLSSLALHYVADFTSVCQKVHTNLKQNGAFIFSVEHPVFTAEGSQAWITDEQGNKLFWPVDHYFDESLRTTNFLGEEVQKYHRTLTSYIQILIENGFQIKSIIEPQPAPELKDLPEMQEEYRRPMMLIISSMKV
ncbi:class I SAM-dependent methyltransferase [Listeria ivanovii]|uniref:Class I SAM-dependent methyltransferase n=2 Tax=Listeria ivanovii TaxID=1638 RepID=A0ABS1G4K8_LISIV|nr:class I SAM-dependent methyltransferase [Listeria ivanovii]EFR97080.1 methyltransferase [Listeria ivanovii FSL F6-596]AIS59703.1 SAM-dependent methyltransferase [Listeria ivanovii subsp. londoniensis]MBK1961715.1 class I SAM-dependent methyltransferase [Listeria ivanovii subsp. londoniensis]MBM5607104.1 class I SAM-dependent methyltransferase [Listeria ivanovii]MBM5637469.1 class I SAM-dependent methyltransferase [Listeria ivanovii]